MHKTVTSILIYLFLRVRDALFIEAWIAIIIQGPGLFNGDDDLGRHIAVGNYIIRN